MKFFNLLLIWIIFLTTSALAQFTDNQKQFLSEENILTNPGCEAGLSRWTNSAGTFTRDTSVKIRGSASCKVALSSQTLALTQDSTLNASQFNGTVQGVASVRVKSDVALNVCVRQAGATSTSLCVSVPSSNTWGLYKIPFVLGATSNGISIASSGAVTGTVYVDDAFVGPTDTVGFIPGEESEITFQEHAGLGSTRTKIPYFTNARTATGTGISYTSSTTNGLEVTIARNAYCNVSYSGAVGASAITEYYGIGKNLTDFTTSPSSRQTDVTVLKTVISTATSTTREAFSLNWSGPLNAGDKLYPMMHVAPSDSNTVFYFSVSCKDSPERSYSASCGAACETHLTATATSAGVATDTPEWIGNASVSDTSLFTYTITGFTVAPACDCNSASSQCTVTSTTSSTVVIRTKDEAGASKVALAHQVFCDKQGVDVVLARTIVGSFKEVMTVPGVIKPVLVSASIDSAEAITDEEDNFLSSCTNADPSVCSFTTSYWSSAPKCWAQGTTAGDLATVNGGATTSSVSVDRATAGTPFALFCKGGKL